MTKVRKILVIDDMEQLLSTFLRKLKAQPNVEPYGASTPAAALALLSEHIRDLDMILIDGNLGEGQIDGAELAEQILEAGYTGMMIAMSSDEDMNERMMHAGCRDSVPKEHAMEKAITLLRLD